MFNQFFSGENLLFRSCTQFFDLVVLSVLWAVLCVPIVTIGPATAALYYTVVKCVRRGEPETLRNFFASFRENCKTGIVVGLVVLACGLPLYFSYMLVTNMARTGESVSIILYYAESVVLTLLIGLACWLFPLLSRFALRAKQLFALTLQIGMRHLPTTILVSLLVVFGIQITLAFAAPILLAPGLVTVIASLLYERIFFKYTPVDAAEKQQDEEQRPWYLKK